MTTRTAVALSIAALCTGIATSARAYAINDWDVRSRTIPASACTPRDSAQAALLEMVQGAWRFTATATGRVTLTCPFPISSYPADQAQYIGPTSMQFYRVWYRDSDGPGATAALTTLPYARLAPLGGWSNIGLLGGGGGIVPPGVCQFVSNGHPETTFVATVQPCVHDIYYNAMYSFEVTLSRTATTQAVEFHGIDFIDGLTPQG
ncbi:MAG: hypothetical protein JSR59_14210 [Proteobacteria bacterium]|nr:hypothetical protein [Pseudomonadota bacterium]